MAGGKPLNIVIDTDVDGVVSGAAKVADSFEDIQDSLKDTEKASDKATDGIEDDFKDAAKVIDRDLTKALDEVEDNAKSTGKSIGKNVKDGTDKAGKGMEELGDESKSTAKEAAASFGDITDAADALQEVLANALAGFGPAGAAIGIAAAIGVGLLTSSLQENADKINENKEKMLGLAQTIKDNGGTFSMADSIQAMDDYGFAIQDSKEWFEIFQEDAKSGFDKIREASDKTGTSVKDVFLGQFGSANDAKRVLAELESKMKDLEGVTKDNVVAVDDYGRAIDTTDPAIQTQITSTRDLSDKVKDHIKELEAANEIEKIRRDAIAGTVEATLEDVAALEKRNGVLQDGATSQLDYLDQVAETKKTLEENGNSLDINTQKGRDNQRSLIDQSKAAIDMAQGQLTAGTAADVVTKNLEAQREALLLQLDGMTGSRAESEKLAASLGLIPKDVITEIKTNGAAKAKTDIDTIPATKDTTVNVADTGTPETQARIEGVHGKEVKIDVDDMLTVQAVQGRIDGIRGRDLVKIDVDDDYTVSEVQKRINGIKGTDVSINVNIANLASVEQTLRDLTATRTAYVDIIERPGKGNSN